MAYITNKRVLLLTCLLISSITILSTVSACGAGSRANVIRFYGISYESIAPGRTITKDDLGDVFATVQFSLEDNNTLPGYQIEDGDASYLKANVPIFKVKGYKSTFRLAAYDRTNSYLQLFEADVNIHAKTGRDLLDIEDKVSSVQVKHDQILTTIQDDKQITQLLHLMFTAPLDQRLLMQDEVEYQFIFSLKDGTIVTKMYGTQSRIMSRGILLPPAFSDMLEAIFKKTA